MGEERKRAAHSEACHTAGVTFIPMVVESPGGWAEEAVRQSRTCRETPSASFGNSSC